MAKLPLSLHDVEECAELDCGLAVFAGGFGALDDAGAGKESGAAPFNEGGAEPDNHLAFVAVVEPSDGTSVEAAVDFLEVHDGGDGGFAGGAADGGCGMEFGDDVEEVNGGVDVCGDFSAEVLDVGEGEQTRLRIGMSLESAGSEATEDGVADTGVFVEVFIAV